MTYQYNELGFCVKFQAIKNIPKGEEICENYGPIFFHSDREDRQVKRIYMRISIIYLIAFLLIIQTFSPIQQRLKKQYWFDCQCIPCKENWPLMHEMSDEVLNFRCHECNGVVPFSTHATNPLLRCVCGTPVEVLKVYQNL